MEKWKNEGVFSLIIHFLKIRYRRPTENGHHIAKHVSGNFFVYLVVALNVLSENCVLVSNKWGAPQLCFGFGAAEQQNLSANCKKQCKKKFFP